jgi:hypothetical protein
MSTPEQIQQRIEDTRRSLSQDVDRLSEKVSPARAVERRVDRMKSGARATRDKLMGVGESAAESVSQSAHTAAESAQAAAGSAGDALSSVGQTVGSAGAAMSQVPQQVRRQAQGSPLVAGAVAFGVGWLIASLLPSTPAEQRLVAQAEGHVGDLAEPVKQAAQEVIDELHEPAQHAVHEVASTATEAAQQTAQQARSAAEDVKNSAMG